MNVLVAVFFRILKIDKKHFGGSKEEERTFFRYALSIISYPSLVAYISAFLLLDASVFNLSGAYDVSLVWIIILIVLATSYFYLEVFTRMFASKSPVIVSQFGFRVGILSSSVLLSILLLYPTMEKGVNDYLETIRPYEESILRNERAITSAKGEIQGLEGLLNTIEASTVNSSSCEVEKEKFKNQRDALSSTISTRRQQKSQLEQVFQDLQREERSLANLIDSLEKLYLLSSIDSLTGRIGESQTEQIDISRRIVSIENSISSAIGQKRALDERLRRLEATCNRENPSESIAQVEQSIDSISQDTIRFISNIASNEATIQDEQNATFWLGRVNPSYKFLAALSTYSFLYALALSLFLSFAGDNSTRLIKQIQSSNYLKRKYKGFFEEENPLKRENGVASRSNLDKKYKIDRISIDRLDIFDDIKWELDPKVNILLGRNGYGKSHLFRILIAMLTNEEDALKRMVSSARIKGKASVFIDSDEPVGKITYAPNKLENTFGYLPILAIPDLRSINRKGIVTRTKISGILAQYGAFHMLNQEPYESIIENLLVRVGKEMNEAKGKKETRKMLERIVYKLAEEPFLFKKAVEKDTDNLSYEIFVKTTSSNVDERLPLNVVSQGTLSVLAIFGLIRQFLNGLAKVQLNVTSYREAQAVVLIDEVDAHLHPSWQMNIVNLLTEEFPNVQFILSAHSPLVVRGRKEMQVASLDRFDGRLRIRQFERDFVGVSASEIYDSAFKILNNPDKVKSLEDRVLELESKKVLSTAEKEELMKGYDELINLKSKH